MLHRRRWWIGTLLCTSPQTWNTTLAVSAADLPTKQFRSTMSDDPWKQIGGGAVNEKKRSNRVTAVANYDPINHQSHLYHSLEGLYRYPNYLNRWNNDADIERLEEALQAQLNKVRAQRQSIQHRKHGIHSLIQNLVQREPQWKVLLDAPTSWDYLKENIFDPRASKAMFGNPSTISSGLPSVKDVLTGRAEIPVNLGRLEALIDEECFDVYGFPVLSPEFCSRIRSYVCRLIEVGSESKYAGLELGRRPIDLDTIGLGWVSDLIFYVVMKPIAAQLFQVTETGGPLDWRQAYVAGYAAQPSEGRPREQLVTHTDDSEVTMNICLSDDFTGGKVEFRGLRGTPNEGELVDSYEPVLGRSIMHAGRHFHDVTPVESGERFVLILWARSWTGVRSKHCPCCWLNRRDGEDCICGTGWN